MSDIFWKVVAAILLSALITTALVKISNNNQQATNYVATQKPDPQESDCAKEGAMGAAESSCTNYIRLMSPTWEDFRVFIDREKQKYKSLIDSGIYIGRYQD